MEEKPVKKALSSVLAILLTLAMLGMFAACKDKPEDPTEPEITTEATTEAPDTTTEDIITEDGDEPSTEDANAGAATEAPDDVDEPDADAFAPPANLNTLSKAEQLEYFNKVTNRVRAEKPGFKYDYLEELGRLDFTGAVNMVSGLIDSIKKSLMPGEWELAQKVDKNADNKGKFMSENANASDLRANDVSSITSTKSGDNWVIRVNIVQENNPAKGTGSAHSRIMPIASRQEVLDEITGFSSLISADVNDATLRYHSAYATITVNSKGQVIGGEYSFKVDAKADNVKISFIGTNVTAPQSTIKKYYDFVW